MDASGILRAQTPAPSFGKSFYLNYTFRDYFRAAKALPTDMVRPVYVSRAFHSTSDDRYKLAIVSPIRGEGGEFLGLLAAEVATDRRLAALELSDYRRIAVLTVRRDRDLSTDDVPNEHIALAHNDVGLGQGVVVHSDALRRLTARRDAAKIPLQEQLHLPPSDWVETEDDYFDLLAKPDSTGRRGPWLAGVAPVGSTELAVIVQTRVEDATAADISPLRVLAAWSIGSAVLLFAGLLAALRTRENARRQG